MQDVAVGRKSIRFLAIGSGTTPPTFEFSPLRRTLLFAGGVALLAGCGSLRAGNAALGTGRYLHRSMPYEAFDALPSTTVELPTGSIQVAFAAGEFKLPKVRILSWIRSSAETVAGYYGRFPVKHVQLLVVPVDGDAVRSGNAFAYGGAAIRLLLGRRTSEAQLDSDWVLVHEMVHLAFPSVGRRHHWIEEGLAPHGLPRPGDRGLDHTPTWGRTYWGGAMFCLLADVQIRERTANRKGLQDALRGILAAGGNMEDAWPIAKAFAVGDAATGVPVLMTLYDKMKDAPVPVDLANLWRRLGITRDGDSVVFKNDAPLAAIRRAIARAPRVS